MAAGDKGGPAYQLRLLLEQGRDVEQAGARAGGRAGGRWKRWGAACGMPPHGRAAALSWHDDERRLPLSTPPRPAAQCWAASRTPCSSCTRAGPGACWTRSSSSASASRWARWPCRGSQSQELSAQGHGQAPPVSRGSAGARRSSLALLKPLPRMLPLRPRPPHSPTPTCSSSTRRPTSWPATRGWCWSWRASTACWGATPRSSRWAGCGSAALQAAGWASDCFVRRESGTEGPAAGAARALAQSAWQGHFHLSTL